MLANSSSSHGCHQGKCAATNPMYSLNEYSLDSGTHYPSGLYRMLGAEFRTLETADTDIRMCREGLLPVIKFEDAHRTFIDTISTPTTEQRINQDFNKKRDGYTLHDSHKPRSWLNTIQLSLHSWITSLVQLIDLKILLHVPGPIKLVRFIRARGLVSFIVLFYLDIPSSLHPIHTGTVGSPPSKSLATSSRFSSVVITSTSSPPLSVGFSPLK